MTQSEARESAITFWVTAIGITAISTFNTAPLNDEALTPRRQRSCRAITAISDLSLPFRRFRRYRPLAVHARPVEMYPKSTRSPGRVKAARLLARDIGQCAVQFIELILNFVHLCLFGAELAIGIE